MKLFIVMQDMDTIDGVRPLSVFNTREKAKAEIEKLEAEDPQLFKYDIYWYIEELRLNDCT